MMSNQSGMRKLARLENREMRLRKNHTLLHGIDDGFKGESV
jgi:hypothetical protein